MVDCLFSLAVRLLDGAEKYETLIQAHWSQTALWEYVLGLRDLARQIQEQVDGVEAESRNLDKLTLSGLKALREQIGGILAEKLPVQHWGRRLRPAVDLLRMSNLDDGQTEHDGWLSAREIATRFHVPREPVRKRLERFRQENLDGWAEVKDPRPREPHYRYKLSAVRHLFRQLVPDESSTERPSKKIFST